MRYLSVCSGIEAATVAWHPLGWEPAAFSDIEAFPRAVLRDHYPDVPLHGRERRPKESLQDYAAAAGFQTIEGGEYGAIDLLVGGTPCQSFSVAGLRGGLADERGNLALEYLRLACRTGARWLLWENVPGVLSSSGGRDFGAILGGLAELGYGFAYRVCDAQYFGVPQRRRRVFVVGYLGDWRRAAAVLLERESLRGDPAPRRKARSAVAALTASGTGAGGADDNQAQAGHLIEAFGGGNTSGALDVATTLTTKNQRVDFEAETFIAHTLRGEGHDASEDGTGRGAPRVPVHAIQERAVSDNVAAGPQGKGWQENIAYTLEARSRVQAIAFSTKDYGGDALVDLSPTLRSGGHDKSHANAGAMPSVCAPASGVRRLTPRECERLQGFPDDYTRIPWRGKPAEQCPDGPRYRALGNSMAVPVMRWIGQRIAAVEAMDLPLERAA